MSYVGKITDTSGNTGLVGSTLYGTCSTGASTAAKVVTCADFDQLLIGVTIHVKFTYSNTASTPTLNVNGTGAKNIYRYGTTKPGTLPEASWYAGSVVSFTYDGSYWMMNDNMADLCVNQLSSSSTDADYNILSGYSNSDNTEVNNVRKTSIKYNPSDKQLSISDTSSSSGTTHNKAIYMSVDEMKMYKQDYSSTSSRNVVSSGADLTGLFTKRENWNNATLAATYGNIQITPDQIVGKYGTTQKFLLDTSNGNEVLAGSLTIGNPDTAEYTGLKYDGSRGALTIVGGQQYSGAAFYEPILTVKNNSQTMGTASINITPENIYFQDDTWDGTNASLKDAISSLNSRIIFDTVVLSLSSPTAIANGYAYIVPYSSYAKNGYVVTMAFLKWGQGSVPAMLSFEGGDPTQGLRVWRPTNQSGSWGCQITILYVKA